MAADGETQIPVDEYKPKEPKDRPKGSIKYDENEPNLVPIFMGSDVGKEWLKKISKRVMEDFQTDFDATNEYRERMKDDFKIFAGELKPKKAPYQNCANAHLPIMLENLSRLVFRANAELFNDWKQPFGVVRVGDTEEEDEIVDVLTVHGNWQIREALPDFRRQVGDRGLLLFFLAGDVTGHSYYDPVKRRNCHEILTCDDFVAPFVYVTTQPDYSDLPHYTKILQRYRHEISGMRNIWYGIDRIIDREPPDWDDEPESRFRQALAEVHREEPPTGQKASPYKLLQYEGWLEMPPSQQEGKGAEPRERFCQVIIDHFTRAIASLTIHEEPPWHERERFDRQTAELDQYRQQKEVFDKTKADLQMQQTVLQQQVAMGQMDPMAAEEILMQNQQQDQMLQEPLIPEWVSGDDIELAAPAPMRKEPIHMFSHAVCIEPVMGNLGLSYGKIQADYNRAADITLSQFIDSATYGNIWSLITSNQVQFEQGFEFAPGRINKVTGFSGKLDEHIKEMKPAPANPQMFDFVRFMQEIGQSSIQAPNVLSGEPGKSGETYRGIAARIEQATKQLTVATQKYAHFVRQILKNNARLNANFLPEEEMRYLMDYKLGELRHIKVERRLYERNYDVVFESDLRYAPQAQKIAEADEITQMAMTTPVLQSNLAFQYEALKRSLKARGRDDLVLELGAKPPVPQMFGMPSLPPEMMGMLGAPPQGQQQGETPADGGGMEGPSPGVASGPAPAEHPPGPGGPVAPPN